MLCKGNNLLEITNSAQYFVQNDMEYSGQIILFAPTKKRTFSIFKNIKGINYSKYLHNFAEQRSYSCGKQRSFYCFYY